MRNFFAFLIQICMNDAPCMRLPKLITRSHSSSGCAKQHSIEHRRTHTLGRGRIVRGGADDSFGIEVAKLAGVPDKVVRRAKEVLKSLESGEMVKKPKNAVKVQQEEPIQLTMLTKDTEVLNRLKSLDVNTLTPIESMNILFELANMLK